MCVACGLLSIESHEKLVAPTDGEFDEWELKHMKVTEVNEMV